MKKLNLWSKFHKAGSTRPGAQPSARHPPTACGGSVLAGPQGARRPLARRHALGPGMGKSGGGPSTLATPPPSHNARLRKRRPSSPPVSGGEARPSASVADERGTLEDGRGGGMRPNRGFQSRL